MQRPSANLTTQEIQDICEGLKQKAAQRRYLKSLGLTVKPKPNGKPLVAREEWERIMVNGSEPGRVAEAAKPDRSALLALLERKNKNGTPAQR